mgnify:CR=1 FL=1
MEASIRLGKIWGIPVGLHTSWFLVFALVTWSLAVGYFPGEYPSMPRAAFWALGAVTSLLFFGSVLVHELVHSFVALRHKIPVHGVTLFIFGGVAQIGREPSDAGTEFRIALAGPLASLGLAAGFAILWWLGQAVPYLAAPGRWLMRINAMLALFNLIPGFPLDGGRVLRAALWHFIGSFQRATQIATFTGQLFAFGFIGLGVLVILGGNFINGLWLVFIGWFLQNAAAVTYAQTALQKSLRDITVAQAMTRDCQLIPPQIPLSQLIEEYVLTGGQRCFFVTENERLRGLLTLTDMAKIPKGEWAQITAGQIMIPWDRIVRVRPDMALLAALQAMDDANVNQVPVLMGEELVGMLSREQVLRYIRTRSELGI